MELSRCPGCMEPYAGYPCPRCGYDPAKNRNAEYALPPESILAGKYLVGKMLGQGGFGITYVGLDIAMGRKVAIKEYFPSGHVARTPGAAALSWYANERAQQAKQGGMEMSLKEARKMARVDRIPDIVHVLDLFRENNTAYIVMDFIEGETLKARLQRQGPLTWEQAQAIFRPAIFAMAAVHKAGLIHRDISPDNLMLTPDSRVIILDLGAAKDLLNNSGVSSMQVAKRGFSPLEQYIQRGGSGPWTDVYAMGATVYYALTGIVPPNAVDRIDKDPIFWDLPQLQSLPKPVLAALRKSVAVSAKNRTRSMEELARGIFAETMWQPLPSPPVAQKTLIPKSAGNAAMPAAVKSGRHIAEILAVAALMLLLAVLICRAIAASSDREKMREDAYNGSTVSVDILPALQPTETFSETVPTETDIPRTVPTSAPETEPAATETAPPVEPTETELRTSRAVPVVGEYVTFGAYEQDDNVSNGKEKIEWLVLAREGNSTLLISRYTLDAQKYNEDSGGITWENCSLRGWLNDEFYNAAFSSSEKEVIVKKRVTADKNPKSTTDSGEDTEDFVFLLSYREATEYITDVHIRRGVPTDYAISRGANTSGDGSYYEDGRPTGWWWLRTTPGEDPNRACNVIASGGASTYGATVYTTAGGGVRPVIWVDWS